MEPSANLIEGADLTSSLNSGGDILIMPGSKKKGKKGKQNKDSGMVNEKKKPQLSKSQKRKLKKIEEEKEKELLLSRSIEAVEKYKIPDDVYSLMWSSRNLGQVETVREKRIREFEFSKKGLELPVSDRPSKKRTIDHASNVEVFEEDKIESEAINGSDCLQSSLAETETLESSHSRGEVVGSGLLASDGDYETILPSVPEIPEKSTLSCAHNEDITKKDTIDREKKCNINSENDQGNCSSPKKPIAPIVVHVSRPPEVVEQRTGLPIIMMEQEIMETINENNNVIICGETGCGKTTQVPQFLYEAGYGSKHVDARSGMIGVTQPRRVAVLATAKRVAFELGLRLGKEVGFQVRHDRRVGENCSVKFMTDGILLREVQSDFLLKRYSVLILDEAHERSLNTDILIGMLSRVVQLRQGEYEKQQKRICSGETINRDNRIYPLKLLLMSATLNAEDFLSNRRIFRDPPPVINIPTRQHKVSTYFLKKTAEIDYIGEAFKKVLSIHRKLPPGGILVFVTGQREVEYLCQKLRRASKEIVANLVKGNNEASSVCEEKPTEEHNMREITEAFEIQGNSGHEITERFGLHKEEDHEDFSEDESYVSYDSSEESYEISYSDDENQSKLRFEESDDKLADVLRSESTLASLKAAFDSLSGNDVSKPHTEFQDEGQTPGGVNQSILAAEQSQEEKKNTSPGPMRVMPLYAMLPAKLQLQVFENVKDGERLVVVATNVAETSLTIPGIKYVVDTGREKVKNYNSSNGMETYEIQWISKASAKQRAGRAGRTGPGHCYRLYSAAAYQNVFPDFSSPEISKVPVDGVVLLMKSMHIVKVANFPFPTPPETKALIEAERCLSVLEALDDKGSLTPLGKAMARYPVSPRHSRMLLTVIQRMQKFINYDRANLVLAYSVATAAALSLSNPFLSNFEGRNDVKAVSEENEKEERKKLKQNAKLAREKFCNPTSDALSIAFGLQCFELSGNHTEFCSENGLHLKTMEEMSKLRRQLLQLVISSSNSELENEFSWTCATLEGVESAWSVPSNKNPLKLNEQDILRQGICAGWADRVAKRIIKGSSVSSEGERKVNAARYQACMVEETVFLHRWSSVSKFSPNFLVYTELLHTKRPYINGATEIDPKWLVKYARSLCTFSASHPDQKPDYDSDLDQVVSRVDVSFGPHLWQLQHDLPIKDDSRRAAAFAYLLLQGEVLQCLKKKSEFMVASPASILKPESLGLKRVGNLLNKLYARGRVIDSRAKLKILWKQNHMELYPEILDWFKKGYNRDEFDKLWVDMLGEVLVEAPTETFSKRISRKKKRIH